MADAKGMGMSDNSLGKVAKHVQQLVDHERLQGLPDGALLERFQSSHDQDALQTLVQRHHRMVFTVCRRLLGNPHDAEDAFQATFLLLVRNARSIRKLASVGSWLYGAAYRVASKARTRHERRTVQEQKAAVMVPRDPAAEALHHDLHTALAAEVERLPEKYRLPVVLCCLEDRSSEEAARLLGWPIGTLWGRLARARDLLRERLGRRGFALSAAGLSAALAADPALATPPALVTATVDAMAAAAAGRAACGSVSTTALELMEGVHRTMFLRKMQTAALGIALGLIAAGVGWAAVERVAAPVADGAAEKPSADFPAFPGKFVPAEKPTPGGGQVVLYSRNRHGSYPLAAYAFHLGMRNDNAEVANFVNLVFGNRKREDAFAGVPVDAGPPPPAGQGQGQSVAGAVGMDGANGAGDEFRVNCYGGTRNRIVDLGEVDFAKVALPRAKPDDPEAAVDDAFNIVPVKAGHVYVLHVFGKDGNGVMKNFYVKLKVLKHRDNDAVLLEWAPLVQ